MFKNLIYKNQEVKDRLDKFINLNKNEVYLITDFDRTITPHFNNQGDEVTTWDLLSRKLPKDIRNEEVELYKKYRPLEVAGKLTVEDAVRWWSTNLDYYKKSKLKWSDLALEVEEAIPARPGAIELFNICSKKEIPIIIVSAGIKDVIELWCEKFEIYPQIILSTNLYFDPDGYISGWDKGSLVHNLNKNTVCREYLKEVQKKRPYAILLGDSLDDAAIVDSSDNILKFFIDDSHHEEIKDKHSCSREKAFEKFDIILEGGDLESIVRVMEFLKK